MTSHNAFVLQGKAQERLTAALRRCPKSATGNRSKLLKYLVPVQVSIIHKRDLERPHAQKGCYAVMLTCANIRCGNRFCLICKDLNALSCAKLAQGHVCITPGASMQLLLGRAPAAGLLQRHKLHQYDTIVDAVRTGSIGALNQALAANQRRFIMEVRHQLLHKLSGRPALLAVLLQRL